ncbi:uncharacterized protein LOC130635281 [Hydractinia symbiolongicarpus]|uniref:uncharacterized protein LOC130635281 n=1 Tax=Hydractinia symbiolongicarpus TaxID=13093 RepID=UPI00254AFBE6|nr:uncharacterized protein LOC130635281 [Hydractinia symbiolongicarpus]
MPHMLDTPFGQMQQLTINDERDSGPAEGHIVQDTNTHGEGYTDMVRNHKKEGTESCDNTLPKENMKEEKVQGKNDHVKSLPISSLNSQLKIAAILDIKGRSDVMTVAKYLNLSSLEIKDLESHNSGGGRPALSFFETLKIKKFEEYMIKLKTCFKENKMVKAGRIISHYNDLDALDDLTPLDIDKLANVTTVCNETTAPDWKCVAEFFEMADEIPAFKSKISIANSYSPTLALFQLIATKYFKEINIGIFYESVKNAGNQIAAKEIEDQISIIAQRLV